MKGSHGPLHVQATKGREPGIKACCPPVIDLAHCLCAHAYYRTSNCLPSLPTRGVSLVSTQTATGMRKP